MASRRKGARNIRALVHGAPCSRHTAPLVEAHGQLIGTATPPGSAHFALQVSSGLLCGRAHQRTAPHWYCVLRALCPQQRPLVPARAVPLAQCVDEGGPAPELPWPGKRHKGRQLAAGAGSSVDRAPGNAVRVRPALGRRFTTVAPPLKGRARAEKALLLPDQSEARTLGFSRLREKSSLPSSSFLLYSLSLTLSLFLSLPCALSLSLCVSLTHPLSFSIPSPLPEACYSTSTRGLRAPGKAFQA